MTDKPPIMARLLRTIADSEHDHPDDDSYIVDLSRADALDAVKRITDLLDVASDLHEALSGLMASVGMPESPGTDRDAWNAAWAALAKARGET